MDKIANGIYFSILIFISFKCVILRKELSKADKWITIWIFATIISELCGIYGILKYKNNMPVFHIWSPIELFLISMYFNESVAFLKKYKIGIIIGIIGCLVALINVIFFQPINTLNSIFLLFEGFVIICYCLFAFYFLVLKEQEIIYNTHFWFTTFLLVYWSSIFVFWGIYSFLHTTFKQYMIAATYLLWIINILTYTGIGIVFINYRKMIAHND